MAATLQSILGEEVTEPDDTTLVYGDNAKPVNEMEFDFYEELAQDWRNHDRWVGLALVDYNDRHGTDYKVVTHTGRRTLRTYFSEFSEDSVWIHCGFTAAASKDVEYESAAKHFCADLDRDSEQLVSCRIIDGNGCKFCFRIPGRNEDMVSGSETSGWDGEVNRTKPWEAVDPPLSQYSHYLGDGATLIDEAKFKFPF